MVRTGRCLKQKTRTEPLMDTRNPDALVDLQGLAEDIAKLRDLRDEITSGRHAFYKATSAAPISVNPVETPASTLWNRIAKTAGTLPHKEDESTTQATSAELPAPRDLPSRLGYNERLEPFCPTHININGTDARKGRNGRRSRSPYRSVSVEDDDVRRYGKVPMTAPPHPERSSNEDRIDKSTLPSERWPPRTISILKGRKQAPPVPDARKARKPHSPERQNREDKFAKQRRSPSPSHTLAPPINVGPSYAADYRRKASADQDLHDTHSSNSASQAVTIRGPPGMSVRVSQDYVDPHSLGLNTAYTGSNLYHPSAYTTHTRADSLPSASGTYRSDASVDNSTSRQYEKHHFSSSASSSATAKQPYLDVVDSPAQGMPAWSLQHNLARNGFDMDETNNSIIPMSASSAPFPSSNRLNGRDGSPSAPLLQYETSGSWQSQAYNPQVWPSSRQVPSSWQKNSYGQTFAGGSFQQTSQPYAPSRPSIHLTNGGLTQQQPWPPSQYGQYYSQDPQAGFDGSYQGYTQ